MEKVSNEGDQMQAKALITDDHCYIIGLVLHITVKTINVMHKSTVLFNLSLSSVNRQDALLNLHILCGVNKAF